MKSVIRSSVIRSSVIVSIGLLGMSACSISTTASPAVTNGATNSPRGAVAPASSSTLNTTVITAVGTDDEIRAQLVKGVIESGVAANYTFEKSCVTGLVAQLSASDIQAFRVDFRNPVLSAAGQSIGSKIITCDASKTTTT